MTPYEHRLCNAIFRAPPGTEEWCADLAARTGEENGSPTITSFWRPTAEELARLNAGGGVALTIFSSAQPIVSVGVVEA